MREFAVNKSVSAMGRHRLLIAVVAVLAACSVGLAAVGGLALIKSLFITTEVNGEVVDVREVVLDENGKAVYSFPVELDDTLTDVTFSMTEGTAVGLEGGKVTANIALENNTAEVEIEVEENDADE